MIGRRRFLSLAALAMGAGLVSRRSAFPAADAIGNAPTVGLQTYTVRKQIENDFAGTIRKIAGLGIKNVEIADYYGTKPKDVRKMLDDVGIQSFSAQISTETLRSSLEEASEGANIIGQRYLVLGWLPPEERKSLDDYKRLIEDLNRGSEVCKKAGIRLGYHNHDFEFEKIEGKVPYHMIVTETGDLALELDVYWATKAGRDPVKMLQAHPGRIHLLHLKDMDKNGGFTELGRGRIDFSAVLKAATESGVKHAYIEQDETMGDPFDSVKISLEHLRSVWR